MKSSETETASPNQDFMIATVLCFWKLPSLLFPKPKARGKNVLIHIPVVWISSSKPGEFRVLKGRVEQEDSVFVKQRIWNLESGRGAAQWGFQGISMGLKESLPPHDV